MSVTALKKAASSSKVLIFSVFALAITVARHQGWATQEWWQQALENAYYALMGGYSLVEVARAVATGKTTPEKVLSDPKEALDEAKDDEESEEEEE